MKKPLAILLLLSSFILGQNTKIDSLKARVESLEQEKQTIDEAVESIKTEIKALELEEAKKNLGFLMDEGIVVTTTVKHATFYVGDDLPPSERISLGIGKQLTVYPVAELMDLGYCYRAIYGGKTGWIYYRFFNEKSFPELKPIINEMSEKLETIKKKAKKNRAERLKTVAGERRANILKKYGMKTGTLILENKIEVGMTKQMVIAALGNPIDKNITTNRFGVNEQWVYRGERYEYVYIDDGIVSSFQTKY
jgi:hypothetical protein